MVAESVHLRTTSRRGPAAEGAGWRSASCMACGSRVVAGSLGTLSATALHAARPASTQARRRLAAKSAKTRARENVSCEFATRGTASRAANHPSLCPACGEPGRRQRWPSTQGTLASPHLGAAAAGPRLADWRPPSASESRQDSAKTGRRWRIGRATSHHAQ